jgi:hypothetical protein
MDQKHGLVAPVEQDRFSTEVKMNAQFLERGGISFAHGGFARACGQSGSTEVDHV